MTTNTMLTLTTTSKLHGLLGAVMSLAMIACVPGEAGPLGQEDELVGETDDYSSSSSLSARSYIEISNLANCYATGIDAIGEGDVATGVDELRTCFTDSATFSFEFPSIYAGLGFSADSVQSFAQISDQLFRNLGLVRTQHDVTNVVVERTGWTTAIMRSYITAPHVFADESVLNISARFVDDVVYANGQWKIVNREVQVTSVTAWPAFPLGQ